MLRYQPNKLVLEIIKRTTSLLWLIPLVGFTFLFYFASDYVYAQPVCSYCSGQYEAAECRLCNESSVTQGNADSSVTIGFCNAYRGESFQDGKPLYHYSVYHCRAPSRYNFSQERLECGNPYLTTFEEITSESLLDTDVVGCWVPECGPIPSGCRQNQGGATPPPANTPTLTPSTQTPPPTPVGSSSGACNYGRWVRGACGAGDCNPDQREWTRALDTGPSSCPAQESTCLFSPTCTNIPSCNSSCLVGLLDTCPAPLVCDDSANPNDSWLIRRGLCRNPSCSSESNCICAQDSPPTLAPTSAPTITPVSIPSPTPKPEQIIVNIKEPLVGYVYEDKNLDRICNNLDGPPVASANTNEPRVYHPLFRGQADVQVGSQKVGTYQYPNFYRTITEYLVEFSELAGVTIRNISSLNNEPFYLTHRLVNGIASEVAPEGGYQEDFCVTQGQPLWFQVENADVHGTGTIGELLPVPQTANPNDDFYFMHGKPGVNAQGVITSGDNLAVAPLERLQKGRSVWSDANYPGKFVSLQDLKDYYKVALQEGKIQTIVQDGFVNASEYSNGVYWLKPGNGVVTLVFNQTEYTGRAIFIVEGDVEIAENVNKIEAAIVFTGTLTTQEYQKSDPSQTWEEVGVADTRIESAAPGDEGQFSLEIKGMVLNICQTETQCNGAPFKLQRRYFFRDANGVIKDINDYPGERFVYDPTYLLQFNELIGTSHYSWQEVSP